MVILFVVFMVLSLVWPWRVTDGLVLMRGDRRHDGCCLEVGCFIVGERRLEGHCRPLGVPTGKIIFHSVAYPYVALFCAKSAQEE